MNPVEHSLSLLSNVIYRNLRYEHVNVTQYDEKNLKDWMKFWRKLKNIISNDSQSQRMQFVKCVFLFWNSNATAFVAKNNNWTHFTNQNKWNFNCVKKMSDFYCFRSIQLMGWRKYWIRIFCFYKNITINKPEKENKQTAKRTRK